MIAVTAPVLVLDEGATNLCSGGGRTVAIKHRVNRLEARSEKPAARPRCPECGATGDPNQPRKFIVKFKRADEPDDGPANCRGCGRQWRFRLRLDKAG